MLTLTTWLLCEGHRAVGFRNLLGPLEGEYRRGRLGAEGEGRAIGACLEAFDCMKRGGVGVGRPSEPCRGERERSSPNPHTG